MLETDLVNPPASLFDAKGPDLNSSDLLFFLLVLSLAEAHRLSHLHRIVSPDLGPASPCSSLAALLCLGGSARSIQWT